MNCKKVSRYFNRYLDGELSKKRESEVQTHIEGCENCRKELDSLLQAQEMLNFISIPSLPDNLASRIMVEARGRKSNTMNQEREKISLFRLAWQWFVASSMPLRLATFTLIMLAFISGIWMSQQVFLSQGNSPGSVGEKNREGLEWFAPFPPGSIGSAYLHVAWESVKKGNRP